MVSEEVTVTPGPPSAEVVEIWTDGGCKPNPGPGGWAAILRFRGVERELLVQSRRRRTIAWN